MGAFLGGAGGSNVGSNSFLAPISNGIAEKLGLPPQIAQLIVSFVIGKLLSGRAAGGTIPARGPGLTGQGGLDLEDLMGRIGSGQGLDPDYLQASGLAEELAEQTGLDSDTAAQSLQEVFGMLGGQLGGGQPPQSQDPLGGVDLADLLGNW